MQASARDQRRRLVSLTPKGQELVNYSKRVVWPRVEQAVFELCGGISGALLDQLAADRGRACRSAARPPGQSRQGTEAVNHLLDRPAWNALRTTHATLSEGNELARRYRPPSCLSQPLPMMRRKASRLWRICRPPTRSWRLSKPARSRSREGLMVVGEGNLVQMVAERPYERIVDSRIEPLTQADAAAMLALATLTNPGPFTLRAQALGTFWGVKVDGNLVAMAGQRMRRPALPSSAASAPIRISRDVASARCSFASSRARFPREARPSSCTPMRRTRRPSRSTRRSASGCAPK